VSDTAFCLRCDWTGTAAPGSPCPACGEPLFRISATGSGSRPAEPERRPRGDRLAPSPEIEPTVPHGLAASASREGWAEGRMTSRPVLALAVVALLLATIVIAWTRAHLRTVPAAGLERHGTLVYVAGEGAHERLWTWNLQTGAIAQGPAVANVTEVLDAYGAQPGWIGLTSSLPDGSEQASVLRFLGPMDRPVPVIGGDLVSWGPHGQSAVAVRRGPITDDCHRDVSIWMDDLILDTRQREFHQASLCGDVLSVGRDGSATYFTREQNGRIGIFFAGYKIAHRVLSDFALMGISPASDMIVVPGPSLLATSIAPVPARTDGERPPLFVGGTALYWRGPGSQTPLPFGTSEGNLVVQRILGWSPDSLQALVAGSVGPQHGLYLLDAGPGTERRAPTFLGQIDGLTYGAIAGDGTVFVVSRGQLIAFRNGRPTDVELPAGAPAPTGPLVWVR
jgi:hypothetical protein